MTRYSALEVTNVQLRRQVEQLELLCKEQAAAAQQLTKRQQVRFISFNYPFNHPPPPPPPRLATWQRVAAKQPNFEKKFLACFQDRELLAERLKSKTQYSQDLVISASFILKNWIVADIWIIWNEIGESAVQSGR